MDLGRMRERMHRKNFFFDYRKSTLIRQAARRVGRGVIYVDGLISILIS
jgi:hypothetical protein